MGKAARLLTPLFLLLLLALPPELGTASIFRMADISSYGLAQPTIWNWTNNLMTVFTGKARSRPPALST